MFDPDWRGTPQIPTGAELVQVRLIRSIGEPGSGLVSNRVLKVRPDVAEWLAQKGLVARL